jgi:hypothetical protein
MGATGNDRGTEGLPEVQESVLEHAAPNTRQEEITEDWPVVKLVTRVIGPTMSAGHVVFDRAKLKRFFETHSENYLPICNNGVEVGAIPMGSWRRAWEAGELDIEPNPAREDCSHPSPSSPSV